MQKPLKAGELGASINATIEISQAIIKPNLFKSEMINAGMFSGAIGYGITRHFEMYLGFDAILNILAAPFYKNALKSEDWNNPVFNSSMAVRSHFSISDVPLYLGYAQFGGFGGDGPVVTYTAKGLSLGSLYQNRQFSYAPEFLYGWQRNGQENRSHYGNGTFLQLNNKIGFEKSDENYIFLLSPSLWISEEIIGRRLTYRSTAYQLRIKSVLNEVTE